MGRLKWDHIKRLITLTSDYIKRLSLYIEEGIHLNQVDLLLKKEKQHKMVTLIAYKRKY